MIVYPVITEKKYVVIDLRRRIISRKMSCFYVNGPPPQMINAKISLHLEIFFLSKLKVFLKLEPIKTMLVAICLGYTLSLMEITKAYQKSLQEKLSIFKFPQTYKISFSLSGTWKKWFISDPKIRSICACANTFFDKPQYLASTLAVPNHSK